MIVDRAEPGPPVPLRGDDPREPPAALLGREYWLIRSSPRETTTTQDIERVAGEHVDWLLKLEADGVVFLSGPLTSGPGVSAGSGITVLRADSAAEAAEIAAADPFVTHGLRTFEVFGWRVNEGAIQLGVSLGAGRFTWG
jgi:uncharacterized protein YciI